ncbi:MAG: GNAT family N-acetyltransferase [bacterium]|nr:GNAT family N-acetyltransferase [bacterium]
MPDFDRLEVVEAGPAHLEDLTTLFDGYRVFYKQPTDVARARGFISERIARGESVIFLAIGERGGERHALGFVQLFPSFSSVSTKRLWILNDLFVAPEGRRHGVGRMLMERSREYAESTGARGLTLETAVDNLPAQALYESLGWKRDTEFYRYELYL